MKTISYKKIVKHIILDILHYQLEDLICTKSKIIIFISENNDVDFDALFNLLCENIDKSFSFHRFRSSLDKNYKTQSYTLTFNNIEEN